jgi:hypothetical protein
MKIPIPKFYDRAMDWCAFHFLPPDKPTGLRLFGYKLTWLDLAVFLGYPLVAASALFLWTGSWFWFPAVAGSMAMAFVLWGWK